MSCIVRSEKPEVWIAADPKRFAVANSVVVSRALESGDFNHAPPVCDAFRERLVDWRKLVTMSASDSVELDQMRDIFNAYFIQNKGLTLPEFLIDLDSSFPSEITFTCFEFV